MKWKERAKADKETGLLSEPANKVSFPAWGIMGKAIAACQQTALCMNPHLRNVTLVTVGHAPNPPCTPDPLTLTFTESFSQKDLKEIK